MSSLLNKYYKIPGNENCLVTLLDICRLVTALWSVSSATCELGNVVE